MVRTDLLNWREFGIETAASIRTAFEAHPYPGIDKIINYLEKGDVCLAAPGVGVDKITGLQVMNIREIRTDGEYGWSSMLPYYVKKYNMRLPGDFEAKVLG